MKRVLVRVTFRATQGRWLRAVDAGAACLVCWWGLAGLEQRRLLTRPLQPQPLPPTARVERDTEEEGSPRGRPLHTIARTRQGINAVVAGVVGVEEEVAVDAQPMQQSETGQEKYTDQASSPVGFSFLIYRHEPNRNSFGSNKIRNRGERIQ